MNRKSQTTARTLMTLLIVSVAAVIAGAYEIDWYTVDGGGGMLSSGGDFELSGTIGQPDATTTMMTGGSYELVGGFWAGASPTVMPGDCDDDGDVDLQDFLFFQTCYTGPGGPLTPGCECVDFDGDDDVDLADFLAFQTAYTGPL